MPRIPVSVETCIFHVSYLSLDGRGYHFPEPRCATLPPLPHLHSASPHFFQPVQRLRRITTLYSAINNNMSYRGEGRGGAPRSRDYDRDRSDRYDRERDYRGGREYRGDRRGGDRERSRSPSRRDRGELDRERDGRRVAHEGRDRGEPQLLSRKLTVLSGPEYERRRDEGRPLSREPERVRVKIEPRDVRPRDGPVRSYDPNPNNEPYRSSPGPAIQPGGRGYPPPSTRGGAAYHPRGRDGDYDRPLDRRAIEEGRRRREEERARGVVYGEEAGSSSRESIPANPISGTLQLMQFQKLYLRQPLLGRNVQALRARMARETMAR